MGKSESVVMVTDEQIHDFIEKPSRLETFIGEATTSDRASCLLFDWWAIVHYAITDGAPNAGPPQGAIRTGDVQYSRMPAHAIYSATVKALAKKLEDVTDATVRKTLDARDVKTLVYPGRYWASPTLADDSEFRGHLRGYRDFVNTAAAANKGLLFCRYEDW